MLSHFEEIFRSGKSYLGHPEHVGIARFVFGAVGSVRLRSYSLLNPQFQSFKLVLGHALQSHRRGQIQSGNVLHFAAAFYLATELLYFWVSAHFQKHFIRIGDGQCLFNQAMLNQNAMIRRYCQRRYMGRSALALFWVFHCTMLTGFLNAVITWARKPRKPQEKNDLIFLIAGLLTEGCLFLDSVRFVLRRDTTAFQTLALVA